MTTHNPVLLKESIEGLNLKKGSIAVDATLGGGGHSTAILKEIGLSGKLIAIDLDENALERFKIQISKSKFPNKSLPTGRQAKSQNPKYYLESESDNAILVKDNFSNLGEILGAQGIDSVDGILADLGYSSIQLEDESYGMSFLKDAPLDMRLGKSLRITNSYEYTNYELTAKDIVNNYSERDLVRIIKEYGEERFAKNIARKIIEQRKLKPIESTFDLVETISMAVPEKYKHAKTHFATRTFQALRIEVNQELKNLEKFVPVAIEKLSAGGRLAIVSFHSLEDRIVKNIFRENARGCICPPDFPVCQCKHEARIKVITKKPITASLEEIENNPRSRSAKLRICERI